MRKTANLALLLLALTAAPAAAAVSDPAGGLPAATERSLAAQLDRVGPGRFEVAFVDAAPEGAVAAARRLFAAQQLGSDDVAIVVALGERRVGVQVGDGYRARGVDGRTIDRLVAASFAPRAKAGDYPGAVLALATALDDAARTGVAPAGSRGPAPGGGFPLWLVALPVAAGVFMMMRGGQRRVRGTAGDPQARRAELQARHGRALETALRLDGAIETGRFGLAADDPDAAAYARLDADTTRLLGEANALGDLLGGGDLAAVERRLVPLEAELAAVETALADVAKPGAPAVAFEALPRDASELATRLADLQAAYEAAAGPGDPEVEGRIEAARRRLATAPVDLEAATAAVAEAREALRRYQRALDAAADREATAQQGPRFGGMVGPIIMMPPTFGGDYAHRDPGSFGGGSWDGGGGSDDGGSGGGTW